MNTFDYQRPDSLSGALALLREHGADARLLNGGTDLAVGLTTGTVRPAVVIDLKRVAELAPAITEADGGLLVVANTVMADIVRDERVVTRYPALVEAIATIGSIQVRHRSTLPGNICNASPAADTAAPLLVYGAVVHIVGADGGRTLPYDDFVLGPRRTALQPAEIVTAVELPAPPAGLGASFRRVTRRRGVDLATLSVACSVDPAGTTRLAFGAVGPRPFLVVDTGGVLADPDLPSAERDRRLAEVVGHATPITDIRATREYREAMLLVHARRALDSAIRRRTTPEGAPWPAG